MLSNIKNEIIKYYSRSYEDGFMAGTSGNASMLDSAGRFIVITPSGANWRELTEEAMAVITLDGELIEGSMAPSSEWRLHAQIYKTLTDVRAVLHTHSPYATAFAVTGQPIPEILVEMTLFLGGAVPLAPFAPSGSQRLAELTAETLKAAPACLIQNHGVAAVGATMEKAYLRAAYVEDAAKIYCTAATIGTPRRISEL